MDSEPEKNRDESLENKELATVPSSELKGSLIFTPEVIANIVSREAALVDGIVGLEDTLMRDMLALVKGGGHPKGVRVELGDNEVTIALIVSLRYGVRIPATIIALRRKISEAIEQMTGYKVMAINVTINRLFLQDKTKSEALEGIANSTGLPEPDVEFR